MGNSYMSDNVWVTRFSLRVNKVTPQENIAGDSSMSRTALLFHDISRGALGNTQRMGGIIIASSVNRNMDDMG